MLSVEPCNCMHVLLLLCVTGDYRQEPCWWDSDSPGDRLQAATAAVKPAVNAAATPPPLLLSAPLIAPPRLIQRVASRCASGSRQQARTGCLTGPPLPALRPARLQRHARDWAA